MRLGRCSERQLLSNWKLQIPTCALITPKTRPRLALMQSVCSSVCFKSIGENWTLRECCQQPWRRWSNSVSSTFVTTACWLVARDEWSLFKCAVSFSSRYSKKPSIIPIFADEIFPGRDFWIFVRNAVNVMNFCQEIRCMRWKKFPPHFTAFLTRTHRIRLFTNVCLNSQEIA